MDYLLELRFTLILNFEIIRFNKIFDQHQFIRVKLLKYCQKYNFGSILKAILLGLHDFYFLLVDKLLALITKNRPSAGQTHARE